MVLHFGGTPAPTYHGEHILEADWNRRHTIGPSSRVDTPAAISRGPRPGLRSLEAPSRPPKLLVIYDVVYWGGILTLIVWAAYCVFSALHGL